MKRMKGWKAYLALYRFRAVQQMQYRAAALGGMMTQIFFGLIYVFLYTTLYAGTDAQGLKETITYVWIQQMCLCLLMSSDDELPTQVRTGSLAYAMLRPVDQYAFCFIRNLAMRHVSALMRCLPILAVQLVLPESIRMSLPESPLALLQALISLLFGTLTGCAVVGITSAFIMMTLDSRGISAMISLLGYALAGNVVPLTLFPERLQLLIRYQPFAQSLDAPIRMYLHAQPWGEWGMNVGVQLLWLVVLAAIGHAMWQRQLKNLTIQGG